MSSNIFKWLLIVSFLIKLKCKKCMSSWVGSRIIGVGPTNISTTFFWSCPVGCQNQIQNQNHQYHYKMFSYLSTSFIMGELASSIVCFEIESILNNGLQWIVKNTVFSVQQAKITDSNQARCYRWSMCNCLRTILQFYQMI